MNHKHSPCLRLKYGEPLLFVTTLSYLATILLIFIGCYYINCFVNSQTLEITLEKCDFNKEAAVGLLQAVGDRRLSLTITYEDMYVNILIVVYILCIAKIGLS